MSDHARKQIRDAVKALLIGAAGVGDRVMIGRSRNLGARHGDTILIYTSEETSQRDANGAPPILARPVTLHIEIRVVRDDPPDDDLDAIAVEVEQRMSADRSLGGRLRNMQLTGSQGGAEAIGVSHHGGLRLDYRLTYRTPEGAAATIV